MRHLAIILALLFLAGCGGLRQINYAGSLPPAPVPWLRGDPSDLRQYMQDHGQPPPAPPRYLGGLTDRERWIIATAAIHDDSKHKYAQELGCAINEFCHLADEAGGHWRAAYLITGGDLNALCDDMPDAERAAATALVEARRRARIEGLKP